MANMITRSDAEALIDVQIVPEIIKGVIAESSVLKHAKRLQNMTSKQTKLRVANSLPIAGFVEGDTGLKPTSSVDWKNKYLNAEEIAVIIPIPEAVLDDASYDIWGELKPLIVQAFGKVIDSAILFGKDKPASWEDGIVEQATKFEHAAADKSVPFYTAIDKTMSLVEKSGFVPNLLLGGVGLKSKFRNMVDSIGQPIKGTEIDSIPRDFVTNGAWVDPEDEYANRIHFIIGDFQQLVYAIRQDITYKVLDQAVITDSDGNVVLNLAQQDMVA